MLALPRAGFTDVHVVAAQAVPDPDFPTVAFPNPEEPGATDALLATADGSAPTWPSPWTPTPTGARSASRPPAAGGCSPATRPACCSATTCCDTARLQVRDDPLVATTVVSSSMLRSVAAAHGARYAETLTGFKWIVRAGPGLVYGYEEALGYCVDPDAVRDKDGIAAAVLACDLAADAQGRRRRACSTGSTSSRSPTACTPPRACRCGWSPAARDAVVERLRARPPEGWTRRPAGARTCSVLRRAGRSGR